MKCYINHYIRAALAMAIGVGLVAGQTRVDLGSQSKNINFANAVTSQVVPTGTALPGTCNVGQLFFLTSSPVGVYECVSADTWNAVGTSLLDVRRNSGTLLTIGSACSVLSPCNYRMGTVVYAMTAPATVTLNGGQGTAYLYLDRNGNLTAGAPQDSGNLSLSCAACLTASPVTQYPSGSIPIGRWHATNALWDPTGTDDRALMNVGPAVTAGSNITLTDAGGSMTISASGGSGTGGSSGGSSNTPVGTFYNPTDSTQWYRDHLTLASGFSNGADGWSYTGGCSPGGGTGAYGFSMESVTAGVWPVVAVGQTCFLYFPTSQNNTFGWGTYDYWSGSAPAKLWVAATYLTPDGNGTHYIGLGNTAGVVNTTDFIGCRKTGTGNWFAVIRAGGADVAVGDTGFAHDTAVHRVVVDNNGGTANTVRCTVDGSNVGTAVANVPVETAGWTYLVGAGAKGSAATSFGSYQFTIFLQGLPRL